MNTVRNCAFCLPLCLFVSRTTSDSEDQVGSPGPRPVPPPHSPQPERWVALVLTAAALGPPIRAPPCATGGCNEGGTAHSAAALLCEGARAGRGTSEPPPQRPTAARGALRNRLQGQALSHWHSSGKTVPFSQLALQYLFNLNPMKVVSFQSHT